MTLSLATINVNGLRDKKKRDVVFNWLVAKKIDVICLQETHSTKDDLIRWQNEWKNCGGGNSFFNCGTSDSRGVGILLSKKLKENCRILLSG
jgi:exonuclease III